MDSPKPVRSEMEASQAAAGGQRLPDDDIELPPVPDSLPGGAAEGSDTTGIGASRRPRKTSLAANLMLGFVTVATLVVGGWWVLGGDSGETGHPDWRHVVAATEASGDANRLVRVESSGVEQVVDSIEFSAQDADADTTLAVQEALQQNDPDVVRDRLLAAQEFPAAVTSEAVLDPEAHAAIDDQTQFYQVQVFDCCDEDGDIVEIVVNGQPSMIVPIMHEAATISIPLSHGANSISLRGVKDGSGGITVSFRTSEGRYFSRRMLVGEEQQLGVIVR